jgi:hypothetical protein
MPAPVQLLFEHAPGPPPPTWSRAMSPRLGTPYRPAWTRHFVQLGHAVSCRLDTPCRPAWTRHIVQLGRHRGDAHLCRGFPSEASAEPPLFSSRFSQGVVLDCIIPVSVTITLSRISYAPRGGSQYANVSRALVAAAAPLKVAARMSGNAQYALSMLCVSHSSKLLQLSKHIGSVMSFSNAND